LRELREEAGVSASRNALTYLGDASFRGKLNHLYALPVEAEFAPSLNRESQDWRWFHMDELRNHRRLHAPTERLAPLLHQWICESRVHAVCRQEQVVPVQTALPPHMTWDWLLRHVPQVWPFRR
jgi:8-oxo-dGTP pyrophosphatase MutT (NUDIX family)